MIRISIRLVNTVLLVCFMGSFSILLYGQDTLLLTENSYKNIVIERNYKILAARATVEAANTQVEVNKKDLFPMLDFVGSNRYYDERVTPEGIPTLRQNFYSFGLRLSQNIYSGGIVQKNKKLAEIYAEQALAGKEITENDILYLASITYWTAVLANEEFQIWQDYHERFQDFYKTIEDRVEEAIVSKNELLTTQVQLNEIDLQMLQAEKTKEVARLNLKRLAGLPVDGDITLLDSIFIQETLPDTINSLEEAMQIRPEIQMLQQQVLASEQQEKIAKAKYAPSLGVTLGGNYSNGIIDRPEGDFHYNVLATATMPIVRWGKLRDEKSMHQFNTKSLREELRDQEAGVEYEIAEAYYNLQQSLKQLNLSRAAVAEARENLRINFDRYDEGLASIVEVTEAQTFLQNAIVMLFNYRTNYKFSQIEYDKALGRLKIF